MTEAAALAAWLGGSITVLSDGRRGLALGLALTTAAFAVFAFAAGETVAGTALLVGGAIAAGLRLRSGPPGWGVLRPGSTPRITLTVVVGLISLWLAAAVTTGGNASLKFALLTTLILLVARVLQGAEPAASTSATTGIALAIGACALLAAQVSPAAACVVAGVVAVGLQALPRAQTDGA